MNHFRYKDKPCRVVKIIDKNGYLITYKCDDAMMFKRDLFYFCSVHYCDKTSCGVGPGPSRMEEYRNAGQKQQR